MVIGYYYLQPLGASVSAGAEVEDQAACSGDFWRESADFAVPVVVPSKPHPLHHHSLDQGHPSLRLPPPVLVLAFSLHLVLVLNNQSLVRPTGFFYDLPADPNCFVKKIPVLRKMNFC